eukprot:6227647-Prymnesium_polylepis.1
MLSAVAWLSVRTHRARDEFTNYSQLPRPTTRRASTNRRGSGYLRASVRVPGGSRVNLAYGSPERKKQRVRGERRGSRGRTGRARDNDGD